MFVLVPVMRPRELLLDASCRSVTSVFDPLLLLLFLLFSSLLLQSLGNTGSDGTCRRHSDDQVSKGLDSGCQSTVDNDVPDS